MHPDYLAGMNDGNIQTGALMLRKFLTKNPTVPNQGYFNAEFPGSGNSTLDLDYRSVVTTHSVYCDSHEMLPGRCISESVTGTIKGHQP